MSVCTEYVRQLLEYFKSLYPYIAEYLAYLRQFNIESVVLRMALALLCGGIIGLERSRKHRAAGFRTHMLVCLGASITMLLGQYESALLSTLWADKAAGSANADVCRFSAQVINGVGFLGAGTILLTDKQEVKGLTTAAGLWASACMGLAIGAGFYECVLVAIFLILLSMRILPFAETFLVEHTRNINLYLEFETLDNFGNILAFIKKLDIKVYDIDISYGNELYAIGPKAVLSLKLPKALRREQLMAELSKLDNLISIKEI